MHPRCPSPRAARWLGQGQVARPIGRRVGSRPRMGQTSTPLCLRIGEPGLFLAPRSPTHLFHHSRRLGPGGTTSGQNPSGVQTCKPLAPLCPSQTPASSLVSVSISEKLLWGWGGLDAKCSSRPMALRGEGLERTLKKPCLHSPILQMRLSPREGEGSASLPSSK